MQSIGKAGSTQGWHTVPVPTIPMLLLFRLPFLLHFIWFLLHFLFFLWYTKNILGYYVPTQEGALPFPQLPGSP